MNSTRKIKLGLKRILSSLLCLLMITPYLPTMNVHAEGEESRYRFAISCDEDLDVGNLGVDVALLGDEGESLNANGTMHISPSEGNFRNFDEGKFAGSQFENKNSKNLNVYVADAGKTIDIDNSYVTINGSDDLLADLDLSLLTREGGYTFTSKEVITSFDVQIHIKNNSNHGPEPGPGPENGKFRVNVNIGKGIPDGMEPKLRVFFTQEYYDEDTGEEKEIVISDQWYSTTDWIDIPEDATHVTVCARDLYGNDFDKYFQNGYVEVFRDGERISQNSDKATDLFDRFRDPELDEFGYPVKDEDGNEIQRRLYKFEIDPCGEESYEFPVVFSYTRSVSWSYRPEDADNDNYVNHCKLYLLDAEGNMRPYVDEAQSETEVTEDFANYQLTIGETYYFKIVPDYGYQIVGLNINGQEIEPADDENTGVFKFVMSDSNFHLRGVVRKAGNVSDFGANGIGEVKIDGDVIENVNKDVFDFDDEVGGAIRLSTNDNDKFDLNDNKLEINPVTVDGNEVDVEVDGDTVTIGEDDYAIDKSIDINVDQVVSKGKENDYWNNPITETDDGNVTVSFAYPGNAEATYKVAREHDKVVDILDATYANGILSFDTDKFSTFTILTSEANEASDVEFKFGEKTNDHYLLGNFKINPVDNGLGLVEKEGKFYYSGKGNIEFIVYANKEDLAKYGEGYLKVFAMSFGSKNWFVEEMPDGLLLVTIPVVSQDENGNTVFPIKDDLLAKAENGVVQFAGDYENFQPAMQVVCDDNVDIDTEELSDTNIIEGEDGEYYIDVFAGAEVIRFNVSAAAKYNEEESRNENGVAIVKNASWRLIELRDENGEIVKSYPSNSILEALNDDEELGYYELGVPYSDEAIYGIEISGTVTFAQQVKFSLPASVADDFTVKLVSNSKTCQGKSYRNNDEVVFEFDVENAGSEVTLSLESISGLNAVSEVTYGDKKISGKNGQYTFKLNKGDSANIDVETKSVQKLYVVDEDGNEILPDKKGVYNLNYHQTFSVYAVEGTRLSEGECVPNVVSNGIGFLNGKDYIESSEGVSISQGELTTSGEGLDALGKKITIDVVEISGISIGNSERKPINFKATFQFSQPIMGVKVEKATKTSTIFATDVEGENVEEDRYTLSNEYAKDGSYKVTFYSDEACKKKIDVSGVENIKIKRFIDNNYLVPADIDFGYFDGATLTIDSNEIIKNYMPGEVCLFAFYYVVDGDEIQIGNADFNTDYWAVKFTDPGLLTCADPSIKNSTPSITENQAGRSTRTVGVKLGLSKNIKASDRVFYHITLVKNADSYDEADDNDYRKQEYEGADVYLNYSDYYVPSKQKDAVLTVSDILKDYDGWQVSYEAYCQLAYLYLDEDGVAYYKEVGLETTEPVELFTSEPVYESKLGLTKGSSKIYTGQNEILLATAKYSNNTTVRRLEKAVLLDSNGIERLVWDWQLNADTDLYVDNENGKIYLNTCGFSSIEPGKYTLEITAQSGGGVPATASYNFTVLGGIDTINVSVPAKVVKIPGKALSFKATAEAISGDEKPSVNKVNWSVCDFNGDEITDISPLYGKVQVKNGTVTIDKDFALSQNPEENVICVKATAADYDGNDTYGCNYVTITNEYSVPTTVVFSRGYWEYDPNSGEEVYRRENSRITEEAINNKEVFFSQDINGTYVRVLDQYNQEMDRNDYTLKASGAEVCWDELWVLKPGNVTLNVETTDGGKKKKTIKFKIDYTDATFALNTQIRDTTYDGVDDDYSSNINGRTHEGWAKGRTNNIVNNYAANKPIYLMVSGCRYENETEDGYYEVSLIKHDKPSIKGGKIIATENCSSYVMYTVMPTEKETVVIISDTTAGRKKTQYTYTIENRGLEVTDVCSIKADKKSVYSEFDAIYSADYEVDNPNTVTYSLDFKKNYAEVAESANAVLLTFDDLDYDSPCRAFAPFTQDKDDDEIKRLNAEGVVVDLDDSKQFSVGYYETFIDDQGDIVYENVRYNAPAGNYVFYATPGVREGGSFTPLGKAVKLDLKVVDTPKINAKKVSYNAKLAYNRFEGGECEYSSFITPPTATNAFGVNQNVPLIGANNNGNISHFTEWFMIEANNTNANGEWYDNKLIDPFEDTYKVKLICDEYGNFAEDRNYVYNDVNYQLSSTKDLYKLKNGELTEEIQVGEYEYVNFPIGKNEFDVDDDAKTRNKKMKENSDAQKAAYKQWVKDNCTGYAVWEINGFRNKTTLYTPITVDIDKALDAKYNVPRD